MTRTFFYYAKVQTQGLEDVVSSGIFTSNVHPSDPQFFQDLTGGIAGQFPWQPKAGEVIVNSLTLLCEGA